MEAVTHMHAMRVRCRVPEWSTVARTFLEEPKCPISVATESARWLTSARVTYGARASSMLVFSVRTPWGVLLAFAPLLVLPTAGVIGPSKSARPAGLSTIGEGPPAAVPALF
jgi:hypothetical protein